MNASDTITFVNHSSILIENKKSKFSILTDPWYDGLAFNKGWSLLFKNPRKQVEELVSRSKYIFLSHEHPDHFSIPFFKEYTKTSQKFPTVVFQETRDKRVEKYLRDKLSVDCLILNDGCPKILEENKLWVFKCGHIDSGFVLETSDFIHINVNDCDYSDSELNKIAKVVVKNSKPKILYIQFSYASYRPNENWLKTSAARKLSEIYSISKKFNVNLVIPYASMVYFCHTENFHLNKEMNSCKITSDYLKEKNVPHCFLNPKSGQILVKNLLENFEYRDKENKSSIKFWDNKIDGVKVISSENEIPRDFTSSANKFLSRIKSNNSMPILYLIRFLTFKFIFGDIIILITDLNEKYCVNFFKVKKICNSKPSKSDISMSAESFSFFLSEAYGFDTLTVNGRFNETSRNGFRKFVFSVGFTIFNQSGYGVRFFDLFSRLMLDRVLSVPFNILKKNS